MDQEESQRPPKVDMLDSEQADRPVPSTPKLPPLPQEYLDALEGKAIPQNWLWQQRAEGENEWVEGLKTRSLVDLAEEYHKIKRGYEALSSYLSQYTSSGGKRPLSYIHETDLKYFRNEMMRLRSLLKEIEPILTRKIEEEKTRSQVPSMSAA